MRFFRQVVHDLRRHEGCRLSPYRDTEGVWTIGYGHTEGVTKDSDPISQAQADRWLIEDTHKALADARKAVSNFDELDDVRKGVLVNMAFNLGLTRLRGFRKTLAAIENKQFNVAALEMLDSKWAAQVGQRARELASRMATGKIPAHLTVKGD